jgi:hypothetical protein
VKPVLSGFAECTDTVAAALLSAASGSEDARLVALCRNLAASTGRLASADSVALAAGFRSRHQLDRVLKNHGWPGIERLEGWARLFRLLVAAERRHVSLEKYASSQEIDPRTLRDLCRTLTGGRWMVLREAGLAHAILLFRNECVPRSATRTGRRAAIKRNVMEMTG